MQFFTFLSLSVVAILTVQAAPAAPIAGAVEKRSTPLLPKCDIMCTMEYSPVCAVSSKNGKFSQTFSNKCALTVFNCENPDNSFRAVAANACDVDGETAVVPEKRSTPLLPQCNIKCTKEYSPVCAVSSKNGKFSQTFSNKCTLSAFNCENPDNTFLAVAANACDVDGETAAAIPEKRSTPLLPKCNIKCTKEYSPVCAVSSKNGKFSQTFSNKCTLSAFNCENPDNTFLAIAANACDVDGETAVVPEKRSTPLLPKCDIVCTLEYNPVCTVSTKNSQHSQTFSNKCALSVFNCQNPDNTFRAVSQDICSANDNTSSSSPAVAAAATPTAVHDLNIEDFSLEEGREEGSQKCGNMCMMVVDPVCAKDKRGQLRAFDNLCLLNQYKCKHPSTGLEAVEDKSCFLA